MLLLRLQDADGIGPFVSDRAQSLLEVRARPQELKERQLACLYRDREDALHYGFAAVGWIGLGRWFSKDELKRLLAAGFGLVDVSAAHVLARDETQALVASRWPLRGYPAA